MVIHGCPRRILAEAAIARLDELGLSLDDFQSAMEVKSANAIGMLKGHNYFPLDKCRKYVELLRMDPVAAVKCHLAQFHRIDAIEYVEEVFSNVDHSLKDEWWRLLIVAFAGEPRPPEEADLELLRLVLATADILRGQK
tara:strand:+ start:7933 stop:8349 length:417 start_codon:yes stop_codon:yes gene_type:complete